MELKEAVYQRANETRKQYHETIQRVCGMQNRQEMERARAAYRAVETIIMAADLTEDYDRWRKRNGLKPIYHFGI